MSKSQDPVFFIDRSLGKRDVSGVLRALGHRVEIHDDHFNPAALDVDWIPGVAQWGWIILTKDEKIASRVLERQAVAQHQAKMFVLASGNLSGLKMAEAFQKAAQSIIRFTDNHPAPFIAKVYKDGEVKAWKSMKDLC